MAQTIDYLIRMRADLSGARKVEETQSRLKQALSTTNQKFDQNSRILKQNSTIAKHNGKDVLQLNTVYRDSKNRLHTVNALFDKQGRILRSKYGPQVKHTTQAIGELSQSQDSFTGNLKRLASRAALTIPIWFALRQALSSIASAITGSLQFYKDFESQLAKVQVVGGTTEKELKQLGASVLDLAARFGTSFKEMGDAMTLWAQQGRNANEILALMGPTMRLALISGRTMSQVVEDLTAVTVSYNIESEKSIGIVDKITRVMLCFDDKTEILTESGWKNHNTISKEDKVYSMNLDTLTASFKPVDDIFLEENYDEKMIVHGGKNSEVDFFVTPNHKFPIATRLNRGGKYTLREINTAPASFSIPSCAKWEEGKSYDFFTVPSLEVEELQYSLDDWLTFLGWYISEGSICGRSINISQYIAVHPDEVASLKELFKRMKIDYRYDGKQFWLKGELNQLQYWLKEYCYVVGEEKNCYSKKVPTFIKELAPEHIEVFLKTFSDGDGYRHWKKSSVLYTASKTLKDDLAELVTKIGKTPSVKQYKNTYRIMVGNKTNHTISRKNLREVDYKGIIWCVETNPNHTIYARRNGTYYWSGNTHSISADNLAAGLRRLTPVTAQFNISLEESIGLITAVQTQTRRGGQTVGDALRCFDEETRILTKEGWKDHETLKTGDMCLSLNLKTNELEYHPVLDIFRKAHEGIMYEYSGKLSHMNFKVTEGHTFPAEFNYHDDHEQEYSLHKIEEMLKRKFFVCPSSGEWKGTAPPEFITIGETKYNTKDFLTFLGWYLSEGFVQKKGRGAKKSYYIHICQSEKSRYFSDLESFLKRFFKKINYKKESNQFYMCGNRELAEWLNTNCYFDIDVKRCYTKKLPEFIKEYGPEAIEWFLDAYFKGDGTYRCRDKKSRSYTTTSPRLKDDVSELILKIGKTPSVYTKKAMPEKNYRESWTILEGRTVNKTGDSSNIKRVNYKGIVWCPTVDPHHTVYVERKGRCMFSGQTILTRMSRGSEQAIQTIARIPVYLDEAGRETFKFSDSQRELTSILGELAVKWDTLETTQKSQLGVTLAGRRRVTEFLALMNNWEEQIRATADAFFASGRAMEATSILTDTLENRQTQLANSARSLADNFREMGTELQKFGVAAATFAVKMGDNIVSSFDAAGAAARDFKKQADLEAESLMLQENAANDLANAYGYLLQKRNELNRMRVKAGDDEAALERVNAEAAKVAKIYSERFKEVGFDIDIMRQLDPLLSKIKTELPDRLYEGLKSGLQESLSRAVGELAIKQNDLDNLKKQLEEIQSPVTPATRMGPYGSITGPSEAEIEKQKEEIEKQKEAIEKAEKAIEGIKNKHTELLGRLLDEKTIRKDVNILIQAQAEDESKKIARMKSAKTILQEVEELQRKLTRAGKAEEDIQKQIYNYIRKRAEEEKLIKNEGIIPGPLKTKFEQAGTKKAVIENKKEELKLERELELIVTRMQALGYSDLQIQEEKVKYVREHYEGAKQTNKVLEEQFGLQKQINDKIASSSQALKSSISSALTELQKGESTLQEAFGSIGETIQDRVTKAISTAFTDALFQDTGLGDLFGGVEFQIENSHVEGAKKAAPIITGAITKGFAGSTGAPTAGKAAGGLLGGVSGILGGLFGKKSSQTSPGATIGGRRILPGINATPEQIDYSDYKPGKTPMSIGGHKIKPTGAGANVKPAQGGFLSGLGGMFSMASPGLGSMGLAGLAGAAGGLASGNTNQALWGGLSAGLSLVNPLLGMGVGILGPLLTKEKKTTSETRSQTIQIASKIDVTNKKLDIVNRNLLAMKNVWETYILPKSAYFSESRNLEDNFSVNSRRGLAQ